MLVFLSSNVRQEDESPPNKQCSILSDRHWGEPSQSTKGPICVSYTMFHDPVGRSSERIHSQNKQDDGISSGRGGRKGLAPCQGTQRSAQGRRKYTDILSDETAFGDAKPMYDKALADSGFCEMTEFLEDRKGSSEKRKTEEPSSKYYLVQPSVQPECFNEHRSEIP